MRRVLNETCLYSVLRRRQAESEGGGQPDYLIGEDSTFREALDLMTKVAALPQVTALILGETGTGKGLLARALHELSPRAHKPFQQVNCSGLPDSLIEVELYGAEPGAYTDSPGKRVGLVEQAEGGTLFLDEIGSLPLHLQPKLLDFLEDHTYRRVGASQPLSANVRVVAATNRDLEQAVHGGLFRSDLYFRLNVVPIRLPPLRDRGNDIRLLTSSFIDRFNREFSRNVQRLHPDAEAMLLCCSWPGNVRQLLNVIERAMLLCDGSSLTPDFLHGLELPGSPEEVTRFPTLKEAERRHIIKAIEIMGGNRTRAATLLGISRETLRARLKQQPSAEDDLSPAK
ncbi:MAG: sigma 54-interacting transcriptional regulator [Armatimonadetes bacterium]|nr:sigma 54-interacting transcriptional regulator [Armatimonadota bacterium]